MQLPPASLFQSAILFKREVSKEKDIWQISVEAFTDVEHFVQFDELDAALTS